MRNYHKNFSYLPKTVKNISCPYYQLYAGGDFCLAYGRDSFKKVSILEKIMLCGRSSHRLCRVFKNINYIQYKNKEEEKKEKILKKIKENKLIAVRGCKAAIKKGGFGV